MPSRSRYPRYARFLVTGGLVGLLVTLAVVLGPGADVERQRALFFYLGILLTGTGALLGRASGIAEDRLQDLIKRRNAMAILSAAAR